MARKGPEFVGNRRGAGGDGGDGGGIDLTEWRPSPRLVGCAVFAAILLIAAGVLYSSFTTYVPPDHWGIKEIKIGSDRGVRDQVYGPGLVFAFPFNIVHTLPKNVQVLEMTKYEPTRGKNVFYDNAAKIQTSDGFYVDVDVTVLYRIAEPYRVVTRLGTGEQYIYEGILPKAEPVLKQTLGRLTTEDFYNSPVRVDMAKLARDMLDEEVEQWGLKVEHVLVRYFEYSDRIQENIEEKKLQDQLVFTNQSKRKAAEQEQQLARVKETGEMQVEITKQEGDAYRVKREAERDLYVRRKEAEADLLVALAEAKRERLRNEAMMVAGADRAVAMEMAAVLEGLELVLLPAGGEAGINPLNLSLVSDLFGVESGGELAPLSITDDAEKAIKAMEDAAPEPPRSELEAIEGVTMPAKPDEASVPAPEADAEREAEAEQPADNTATQDATPEEPDETPAQNNTAQEAE